MTHPTDDTLNRAWNHMGQDPDVSEALDPTGSVLLRAMQATAASVQPDPAFRDQLWAELSRRPNVAAPAPTATSSLPVSTPIQSGALTMTPRLAPGNRRWSPPIATIVIALVGYGALSLSGANPTGINLNLNEVPNASAQAQGMAQSENPFVGTWAWLDDSLNPSASHFPILMSMTLDAGGGVTATGVGDWIGHGTWSSDGTFISVEFSVLVTQEALKRMAPVPSDAVTSGFGEYIPNILIWTMAGRLSNNQTRWEDVTGGVDYGVRTNSAVFGTNNSMFFVVNDLDLELEGNADDSVLVQRLDSIFESAPTVTAADAGFESGDPNGSPRPGDSPDMSIAGPSATPVTSARSPEAPGDAATVRIQATSTAEAGQQLPMSTTSP